MHKFNLIIEKKLWRGMDCLLINKKLEISNDLFFVCVWSRHTIFKIDDRYYMEKLKKKKKRGGGYETIPQSS